MKRLLVLLLSLLLLTACAAPDIPHFPTASPIAAAPTATAAAVRAAVVERDFDPAGIGSLQSATLTWTEKADRTLIHTAALTDGDDLRTLEGILAGAKRVENIPMCFDAEYRHELTLILADGSVMTVLVSIDACPYLREGDVCFNYERAAQRLSNKSDNTAIYDLFGAVIH